MPESTTVSRYTGSVFVILKLFLACVIFLPTGVTHRFSFSKASSGHAKMLEERAKLWESRLLVEAASTVQEKRVRLI